MQSRNHNGSSTAIALSNQELSYELRVGIYISKLTKTRYFLSQFTERQLYYNNLDTGNLRTPVK